ncbi:hypothetical protein Aduo_007618 [Ancylostoma duodenale]
MLSNIRDELHNSRQGKDSVGEFARKTLAKTKVAFQGEDKSVPRKLAIDFFTKELRPNIRKAIRRLPDPSDFETAVANAEKEQRVLGQERREEKDILESINALVLDDKLEELRNASQLPPTAKPTAMTDCWNASPKSSTPSTTATTKQCQIQPKTTTHVSWQSS